MTKIIASILIILFLGAVGTSIHLLKVNKDLNTKISDQTINIKSLESGVVQYKDKYGDVYARVIDQRRTLAELQASKDSTITQLMARLFQAGVKLKDIQGATITTTELVRDTVIKYTKVIVDNTKPTPPRYLDFSKPPYIVNTVLVTDTTATNKLKIVDTVSTFTHVKKEFIEPRKKFFLARWFQKKQSVAYTDTNNANPWVDITNSTKITILDSNGDPKTK